LRTAKLIEVHARLFPEDVRELKRIAKERGISWQIELRLLVRRALRGDHREVIVLKDGE
jgi:hypothetical protein